MYHNVCSNVNHDIKFLAVVLQQVLIHKLSARTHNGNSHVGCTYNLSECTAFLTTKTLLYDFQGSIMHWMNLKKRNFLKVENSITGKSMCSSHSWLKCQLENLVFPWTSLHSATQMWITYAYIDWSLSQEGVGWFWAFSYNLASAWFLALHSKFSSAMINTCLY